jgi:hypothetical protein
MSQRATSGRTSASKSRRGCLSQTSRGQLRRLAACDSHASKLWPKRCVPRSAGPVSTLLQFQKSRVMLLLVLRETKLSRTKVTMPPVPRSCNTLFSRWDRVPVAPGGQSNAPAILIGFARSTR